LCNFVEDHSNLLEFYPDFGEEIPTVLPSEKVPRVRMNGYLEAEYTHDLVIRRSITGILVMIKPFA
jgi:hypothetical protein